jgi:hypothetical protein
MSTVTTVISQPTWVVVVMVAAAKGNTQKTLKNI